MASNMGFVCAMPVYRDGLLVGRTTSGVRGFRTGLSLCLAYVACQPAAPRDAVFSGRYEIGIAGTRYRLRAHRDAPYDPSGFRLRG